MNDDMTQDVQQGSVQQGLAGDYTLSLGDWLSEAWSRVNGNKAAVWKAVGLYIGLALAIVFIFNLIGIGPADPNSTEPPSAMQSLANLVTTLALLPVGVGVAFAATSIALGRTPVTTSVLGWYDSFGRLALTYLLMAVMLFIGFLLLVLPGIYLLVSYQIAMPLAVDKKLGPWEALETSRKIIGHRWFTVFGFNIVAMILVALSSLLFGIPLIWTVPMLVIAYGILYRNLAGLEPDTLRKVVGSA
ncbi:hypothetical protein [Pseudohalioglobus lutimaris]|uniref:DUF975 domain-containing protein n=1 Tax=Pseudohalioglobus lutimaris TaxID=1737061 RepID=A0A2N5X3A1_9GAMM|nr:hypothetical protein [Pseudohalioglobus lutimaris]PLW68953.1 hypothetical protein C0039_10040 [Pseudohalioglobus lutimaris]